MVQVSDDESDSDAIQVLSDEDEDDNDNEVVQEVQEVNDESDSNEVQAIIDESASAVVQAIDVGDLKSQETAHAHWKTQKQKELLKEILSSSIQKIQSHVSQLQEMVSLKAPLKGQRTIDYYFKKRKPNDIALADGKEKLTVNNTCRNETSKIDKADTLAVWPEVHRKTSNAVAIKQDSETKSAKDMVVAKGKVSKSTFRWWR